MAGPEDFAPLPPLPVRNQVDWFPPRDEFDREVKRRLEGYLAPDQLTATIDTLAVPSGEFPGGFQTPGVRRAQFAWGCGNAGAWTAPTLNTGHQRLPVILPVTTKRWRLRIRNANQFGTVVEGKVDFSGIWLGKAERTSTGSVHSGDLTGAFSAAPVRAFGPFSTPPTGDVYVTDWNDDPTAQIAAGGAYLVSMGWTKDGGDFPLRYGAGGMFYSTTASDATVLSPTLTTADNVAFSVSLEYEFEGANRVGIAIGDSLTEGAKAGLNLNSYHQRLSRRIGSPIALSAAYGSQTYQWATAPNASDAFQRIDDADLNLDFAIIALGSNDANSSIDLATFQSRLTTIIARVKARFGVHDVYLCTVAPRNFAEGPEAVRVAYNQWLATLSYPLIDIADEVADPANPIALRPDSNAGDGTHWSSMGNWRAQKAFPARL